MRKYSINIDRIYHNINRNAKSSNPMKCYSICANKEKLEFLKRLEPQIIYGRRGTGKTTLLKSFFYLINEIEKEDTLNIAWYISLDDCVPTILANTTKDDVLILTVRNFIKKLNYFFIEQLEKLEKNINFHKTFGFFNDIEKESRINTVMNHIADLDELIKHGSPDCQFYSGQETIEKSNGKKTEGKLSINPIDSRIGINANAYSAKKAKSTLEKKINYALDLSQIRDTINQIIDAFSYQHLYVCIDEFYQIDKELNYSLQSGFAQIIKMILFNNEKIVVKIANVWNESKIQSKQFGGTREGLELGHDIFESKELDLDTMFDCDNGRAHDFFTTMLVNYARLDDYSLLREKYNISTVKNIMDSIFGKDALDYLICGSQGIPRLFGHIFTQSVVILRNNESTILSSNIICQGIIENYNVDVRSAIPYHHPLCMAIDDYVTNTHCRFFLIAESTYNLGINFFDGLVARAALHQYPSSRIPRRLRNRYKMFFVHYGNFLDAIEPDPLKSITLESKITDSKLYPQFPVDLVSNTRKYVLEIDVNSFNTNYCDNCHIFYNFNGNNSICPKCGKKSRFWNRLF